MFYVKEGKDMSMFKRSVLSQSLIAALMYFYSVQTFSGGVSERNHESRKHISANGQTVHQLSLDDVLPSSKTTLISNTKQESKSLSEPILIRVTGYSGFETDADSKSEVKRLQALRASKLDAYRALAERVYGLSISGKTVVKDFMLQEDSFAVALNSHVRGARVVSVNEKKGVGFETVLELMLPGDFNDCLNKVNAYKNGLNCLRPLPNTSLYHDAVNQTSVSNKPGSSTGRYHGSGYFLN